MKRLYGLFVLLCLMLTACNDDFLDVDPVDRYSDAVVWTDESLITSFVNNIYEGQKWGFHTVMLSSLCDESMEVWAWESQPVVMSELSPSYQGILAPNFWNFLGFFKKSTTSCKSSFSSFNPATSLNVTLVFSSSL